MTIKKPGRVDVKKERKWRKRHKVTHLTGLQEPQATALVEAVVDLFRKRGEHLLVKRRKHRITLRKVGPKKP
jgi:hypothetical protein